MVHCSFFLSLFIIVYRVPKNCVTKQPRNATVLSLSPMTCIELHTKNYYHLKPKTELNIRQWQKLFLFLDKNSNRYSQSKKMQTFVTSNNYNNNQVGQSRKKIIKNKQTKCLHLLRVFSFYDWLTATLNIVQRVCPNINNINNMR